MAATCPRPYPAATATTNQWKYVADLDLQEDRPLASGIEGEINQVLVNLIVNAAQAIGEKAAPTPRRIVVTTNPSW